MMKGATRAMALAVMLGLTLVTSAMAQTPFDALPPEARARLTDPAALTQALAATPGAPVRVIVEFARPSLPVGIQEGTPQGDARMAAAIAAVQQAALQRAAGAGADPDGDVRLFRNVPMMALTADAATIQALAQDPTVVRIHADRLSRPLLTQSLQRIGMPAALSAGATGQGQVVAVLDSGARLGHEFLSSRIIAGACFNTNGPSGSVSRCPGGATTATTLASSDDCTDPALFGCGHGTHVSGIAAGFNTNLGAGEPAHGVARDARILSINVFSTFPLSQCGNLGAPYTGCILSWSSDQIAALDHVYSLRNTYAIGAVNMSLGGGEFASACTTDAVRPAVQQLTNAGIAVVIAAGNDSFDASVGAPGCIPEAITVGSTTQGDVRSDFSNWGTLVDIAAPGSAILAPYINGSSNVDYSALSGTSMAAPHVAGAFAAIRTAAPSASVADILAALRATGTSVTAAGVTIPRMNVDQALARLSTGTPTTTTLNGPATSSLGQPVTFTITVSATGGTPTGTVSLRRDGTEVATATLAGGQASITTSSLPQGALSMTAAYVGSPSFRASQSAALRHTVGAPPTPANDNFAQGMVLTAPGTLAATNVGATRESGEPAHLGSTGHSRSIWFRLTPAAGTVTLDTCGSAIDTVLAVYTGTSIGALTEVAANDDHAPCNLASRVQFTAVAGTTYHIAVAGYGEAAGAITFTSAFTAATVQVTTATTLSAPANGTTAQRLEFTATVTATPSGTPTGNVSFRRNGAQFASVPLNAQGRATVGAYLPVGTHQITAHYLGVTGFPPSASIASAVSVTMPQVSYLEFVGGGSVFAFTPTCAQNGWAEPLHAVQLRYAPGEVNGMPSQAAILWPTGSEHLQVWAPFAASAENFNGVGRQMWTYFVVQPTQPRVRPVTRRITQPPSGTDIAVATEVMVRLRVENFAGIAGCSATVAGILRRPG